MLINFNYTQFCLWGCSVFMDYHGYRLIVNWMVTFSVVSMDEPIMKLQQNNVHVDWPVDRVCMRSRRHCLQSHLQTSAINLGYLVLALDATIELCPMINVKWSRFYKHIFLSHIMVCKILTSCLFPIQPDVVFSYDERLIAIAIQN